MKVSFSHPLSPHCRNKKKKIICIDMKIFDTWSHDLISIYIRYILDRNQNGSSCVRESKKKKAIGNISCVVTWNKPFFCRGAEYQVLPRERLGTRRFNRKYRRILAESKEIWNKKRIYCSNFISIEF